MSFVAYVDSKYTGKAGYTQLMSGDQVSGISRETDGYELDNSEWPRGKSTIYTQLSSPVEWDDQPFVSLAPSYLPTAMNLTFLTYLRFRPDNGTPDENIYVTLRLVTWGVTATANYIEPTGWQIGLGSSPSGPEDTDSTDFPVWTEVLYNWFL